MKTKSRTNANGFSFVNHVGLDSKRKGNLTVTLVGSRFMDAVWDYSAEIPQKNVKDYQKKIHWNYTLPDGKSLLDPEHSILLESCKEFINAFRLHNGKRGLPKATTIVKTWRNLMIFLSWIATTKARSFSQLDEGFLDSFIEYLHTAPSASTGKLRSPTTNVQIIATVGLIWSMDEYVSHGFTSSPLRGRSTFELAGVNKEVQKQRKFKAIPDEVAVDIGTKATSFIESNADEIIAAHNAVKTASMEAYAAGKSRAASDRAKRSACIAHGFESNYMLTKMVRLLRTSAYIVIALFSGIRSSELSSLLTGCFSHNSDNGTNWISGRIFKTAHDSIEADWIVPPIVGVAVDTLEKLSRIDRSIVVEKIASLESSLDADVIGAPLQASIHSELEALESIKDHLFLVETRDSNKYITYAVYKNHHADLREFMDEMNIKKHLGHTWALHPHQFRKTFVRFMVKNRMNIRYLQEHFKHISLDMTAWYDSDDIELVQEIVEFYNEMTTHILAEIVDSNSPVAGKGGEQIENNKKVFFAGLVAESKEKIIESMASTVTLRSTGHSWCMGDTEAGECTGVHACLFDPGNVNVCSQAIVTKEHLPAWHEMRARNEELLHRNDLGEIQKQAIASTLNNLILPTIAKLEGHAHG